jgi:hypothetical protein
LAVLYALCTANMDADTLVINFCHECATTMFPTFRGAGEPARP